MQGSRSAEDRTILIVDDDEGARVLLTEVLRRAGFGTVAVGSGEEALEAAIAPAVSLVLLDVNLPGVSGYEVCRALRERRGPELPIVFVSGERTESFDRVAGLMIGGDDYLPKPFAPDELLARVRSLLRRTPPPPRASRLTRRELQVLRLLAAGSAQREIASELVISPKTVGTHIERILGKLGVHSRAQAVAAAYRENLIGAG